MESEWSNDGCKACTDHKASRENLLKDRDSSFGIMATIGTWVVLVLLGYGATWLHASEVGVAWESQKLELRTWLGGLLWFSAVLYVVWTAAYSWYYGVVGRREYLVFDQGSFHRHADLPAISADSIVVETWCLGWYRVPRVLRGNLKVVLSGWNGDTLTLAGKGESKDRIRVHWTKILPLLRETVVGPDLVVDGFTSAEQRRLELTESKDRQRLLLEEEIELARAQRDRAVVELIALARLTSKEDPLGWGRSRHGAEVNARLIAVLSQMDGKTVERLRPDADRTVTAFVEALRLVTGRPIPVA